MNKLLALLMALLVFCGLGASGEAAVANPWVETTAEGLVQTVGLTFGVPEGAENVIYRMLESEGLAEMQFSLDRLEYAARIRSSAAFEDISGLYYAWDSEEDCEIGWCPGQLVSAENARLCLWYDVAPGLMYSLSVVAPGLEGADLLAVAQAVYLPAQGEADGDAAFDVEGIRQALAACTGYAGTAGASLKEAIAAYGIASYALDCRAVEMDAEAFGWAVAEAWSGLDDAQREELAGNWPGINALLETAFAEYDTVAGLFDDAGIGEEMRSLTEVEDAHLHWATFYGMAP